MGTKTNPGKFDCYHNALPDEPMFVLLARDPEFNEIVSQWAARRARAVLCGERPDSDMEMVNEAYSCAVAGMNWRKKNLGKWREQHPAQGDGEIK